MTTIDNDKIAEIKRAMNGGSTSKDIICRMYGVTEGQLLQVLNYEEDEDDKAND